MKKSCPYSFFKESASGSEYGTDGGPPVVQSLQVRTGHLKNLHASLFLDYENRQQKRLAEEGESIDR